MLVRLALVVAILIAANAMTLVAPRTMAAARVGGEAYGLAVGNPPLSAPGSAYVQLPPEGGDVADTSPGAGYGVGNLVGSTTQIDTRTTGDPAAGTAMSQVSIADAELLGGLVRARDVRVTATATQGGGLASAGASVTFGSLVVAGVAYPSPQPNTRIDVPGVGVVILNEQLTGGDGRESAAVVARAVRVEITVTSLLDLPRGTDVILAGAAAGVPDLAANRPVPPVVTATPTQVAWAPIPPLAPVDTSLDLDFGNENDAFENDNSENGNDNGTRGTPGTGGGTPIQIVVTVVVVKGTATPTPTPTSTPTPTGTPPTPTPTPTP